MCPTLVLFGPRQYYVKDLLPKLAPPQAVAILEALRSLELKEECGGNGTQFPFNVMLVVGEHFAFLLILV